MVLKVMIIVSYEIWTPIGNKHEDTSGVQVNTVLLDLGADCKIVFSL